MPRKSAASLTVATPITSVPRLKPPAGLTEPQQAHFAALVASVPADRFARADVPLLVALSRHLTRADEIERMFVSHAESIAEYDMLARAAARESSAIASIMTRLRLTPQSRYKPDAAALRRGPPSTPPWEAMPPAEGDRD